MNQGILGDKTRGHALSAQPRVFIRPSPTGGHLGGVARRSRKAMLTSEAAGFDVVVPLISPSASHRASPVIAPSLGAVAAPASGVSCQQPELSVLRRRRRAPNTAERRP